MLVVNYPHYNKVLDLDNIFIESMLVMTFILFFPMISGVLLLLSKDVEFI
jgi:hypothetical protein